MGRVIRVCEKSRSQSPWPHDSLVRCSRARAQMKKRELTRSPSKFAHRRPLSIRQRVSSHQLSNTYMMACTKRPNGLNIYNPRCEYETDIDSPSHFPSVPRLALRPTPQAPLIRIGNNQTLPSPNLPAHPLSPMSLSLSRPSPIPGRSAASAEERRLTRRNRILTRR